MRQYNVILEEKYEVNTIVCNQCGKRIPVVKGVPQEDVLEVEKRWGYHSKKDNRVDRFDLCEDCYDELVSKFQIQLEE